MFFFSRAQILAGWECFFFARICEIIFFRIFPFFRVPGEAGTVFFFRAHMRNNIFRIFRLSRFSLVAGNVFFSHAPVRSSAFSTSERRRRPS